MHAQQRDIHPGDILAGKYRVRAILGRAHGLLVDAFHTEFDQRVVIKVLLPGAGDTKEIERFRREARTLSKLQSEHAARIIDVGSEQDGSFYLVREYLEGTDLGRRLRQYGPLPLQEAVLLVLQAAEAVAETHSHNIIVRELQPATLFLTERPGGAPLVKIIDFGTAKLMKDAAAPSAGGELTATAMFGLSPYSSPEMIRKAKSADQRTDVWSLGAILYEMLTGRPPFSGEAAMLMLQITREDPTPPSHLRPDLPQELDQIIVGWSLAKDAEERFKNVYAFAHALRPYAPPEGQLLIDRIGQITEQGRRRKQASAPPPSWGSNAPGSSSAREPRTVPPPPPSHGGFATSSPPSRPPPAQSSFGKEDSITQNFSQSPNPSDLGSRGPSTQPFAAHASSGATTPPAVAAPAIPQQQRRSGFLQNRVAVGAIAASAVLLPALIAILVLSTRKSADPEVSPSTTQSATAAITTEAAPQTATTPAPPATETPTPVASVSATTSATETPSPTPSPVAVADPPPKQGNGSYVTPPKPPITSDPPPKSTKSDPPATSSTPAASGDKGTLIAIAMGGSCAFSVNGSSKGSGSTIRVQLAPGTYSVMCRPASGGQKSKTVTVKRGETAMATFKL